MGVNWIRLGMNTEVACREKPIKLVKRSGKLLTANDNLEFAYAQAA